MKGRELKRIWGHPWCYGYLLAIEQRKLKEMAAYFKKTKRHVGWEYQVRDCELCVKLIDIIMEQDPYYKSWINQAYGENYVENRPIKFPVHINVRNSYRFWKSFEENIQKYKDFKILEGMKSHLRSTKALYLYNKIRSYRMYNWWD